MMKSANSDRPNSTAQQLDDATVHSWYRFVLSYPDHLVSKLISRFGIEPGETVLDPFVGTGTTLIECKRNGIHSIGVDANPISAFASRVKTMWDIDLQEFDLRFRELTRSIQQPVRALGAQYPVQMAFDDLLPPGKLLAESNELSDNFQNLRALLPKNWISEKPLEKCLLIKQALDALPKDSLTDLFFLALADTFIDVSNLGFGPEVYVSRRRKDADVYSVFVEKLRKMRFDLGIVQGIPNSGQVLVHTGDARKLTSFIDRPADFVICSPPYPNEKDYTRITRLELILLGFIEHKTDLRKVKEEMLRSHTRNVYVADDDAKYVADMPEIQSLAEEIEGKRVERGATSGFERLYHRVVTEYFGGMYRVLEQLEQITPVGAKLAFVVGDQMSYFRVPIYTAKLLSLIARRKLNYMEVETLLWRTRWSTVTKTDVEEHILILERC